MTKTKLPDTTQADVWLTPDIFEHEGKLYIVKGTGKVQRYRGKRPKRSE